MTPQLYAHPFSSYCQKVLTALYENATPFTFRLLEPGLDEANAKTGAEFAARWPIKKMPLLVDGEHQVMEATAIIEHLEAFRPGPVILIPSDAKRAAPVRMMDRIFDNYVSSPQQTLVFDLLRPAEMRDSYGVAKARETLDTIYEWLDGVMAERQWAAGDMFSLADCAAAPALFYADWSHPIPERFAALKAYRARLLARPSFARAVDEARPYRPYFPGGAPDRD